MNKRFLAPIHEFTDAGFRMLCQRYGAESCCVPLVNATAIARDRSKVSLVDASPAEKGLGVQLVDGRPENIGIACRRISDACPSVAWYNLNCGCPSSRTMGCGGGSAMLERPKRIIDAVSLMRRAVDVHVSVKLRIHGGSGGTAELCKRIEQAGADSIILHGRSPSQGYSGKADWETIRHVRGELGIPLVGNGDIRSDSQGCMLIDRGYCDAYMAGRAAMANPRLFRDGEPGALEERFSLLEEYIALCEEHAGKAYLKDVRIKAMSFLTGVRDASSLRDLIGRADSIREVLAVKEQQRKN